MPAALPPPAGAAQGVHCVAATGAPDGRSALAGRAERARGCALDMGAAARLSFFFFFFFCCLGIGTEISSSVPCLCSGGPGECSALLPGLGQRARAGREWEGAIVRERRVGASGAHRRRRCAPARSRRASCGVTKCSSSNRARAPPQPWGRPRPLQRISPATGLVAARRACARA